MPFSLCIVGAGVTGLGLLLLLQSSGVDLSKVVMIDPHFDGGDLARKWGAVQSNTPWSKTANAIRTACPEIDLSDVEYPNETTPLSDLAQLLRTLATPAFKKIRKLAGVVKSADYDGRQWTVSYQSGCMNEVLHCKVLLLCPGAEPKSLHLPIPSIPLECALDLTRLRGYVKPGQKVIVFGTMHSGTLVIRNLFEIGANVTAFYNASKPFVWDRDGAYDGIKEEAATIADAITAGDFSHLVKLVHVTDTSVVIRSAFEADWVVYAMGFSPRCGIQMSVGGESRPAISYDGATGAIQGCPAAWGFGTAYPNRAPDGVHWDVSIAAFLAHMKAQMPDILAALN
jgi:cation diffusion facilitator CzcD-associated flavoprotein CzcO